MCVARIVSFQNWSTLRNLAASSDSCFWMSPCPKIDSRYIQLRWHVIHSSSVCESCIIFLSQTSTVSRIPTTNRDAIIVCSVICESSSNVVMSSYLSSAE